MQSTSRQLSGKNCPEDQKTGIQQFENPEQVSSNKDSPKIGSGPKNYQWYLSLKKPSITPPQCVFPIVWTILYIMIGLSLYFYLRDTNFQFTAAIIPYCIQIVLNIIWTPIFFWKKMITLALVDIVLLWGAILVTISMFYLKSIIAGSLLIPYIIWVTLATYLNAYIVRYNDDPSRSKA